MSLGGFRNRVSNLDFLLASHNAGGEGVRLELERDGEVEYQVGWLLSGRQGKVSITYWEHGQDEGTGREASTDVFSPTPFVEAVSDRGQVRAEAAIRARSVDIAYARDFKSDEKFRATWSLGLRWFRYEHRLEARYVAAAGTPSDVALEEVESTGVGPRVGASFQYYFTRRWSLAGGLGLAALFGSTDHSNVSVTNVFTSSEAIGFNEQRGQSRTFDQADLDLHVVFLAWRGLEVSGGYRVSHWFDARTRVLFDSSSEIERVTFDGPYLNVGYRF